MKTIISGSQHFIIPKKIVMTTFMVGMGAFVGTYISEHMHYRQNEQFIRSKNLGVQESNSKLLREKIAYESIFDELKDHLADWEKGRDMSLVEQAEHVTNFHEQAQELLKGLKSMQDLLEEKEFQLWEKEGLLEYQEERLMDSEDLELEMASFINQLADKLLALNKTLPEGLERRPYYGHDFMLGDDEGDMIDDATRRQLRAKDDARRAFEYARRVVARRSTNGAIAAATRGGQRAHQFGAQTQAKRRP